MLFIPPFDSALRLHRFMTERLWHDGALTGPDPGIRFNYRIFRFIKSYLRVIPWRDSLYYLQAQGYWVLANARLFELTEKQSYCDILVTGSNTMLERQQADGAWPYPNPEWKGRVAVAEGTWASIGLIETYRQTGERRFLDAALNWHRYMLDIIGFQQVGSELSLNYFATTRHERIPNNNPFGMRFLAELADVLGDPSYLAPCGGLLNFLSAVQLPTGELPYSVEGPQGGRAVTHFQCYQYNAFQCLDLMRYYELTGDPLAMPVIRKLLIYLETGVGDDGHVAYECHNATRTVTYHTAAVAAALARATQLHIGNHATFAERCYKYVLSKQCPDGSFPHSQGDYTILSDQRAYPRYLSMILFHLLQTEIRETQPQST